MAFTDGSPNLWDTSTLLGVMREQESPSNYWLNLLFPNVVTFDDEYIDFEKIPSTGRKLAPYVAPMAQGRAIYEEGSRVGRFKPAYVKPSDPVSPARVLKKRPGTLLNPSNGSPMQRYNAIKADILAYHRDAIERRWEQMAAEAAITGKVVIEGDDYPAREVDFGRAANHTVVLGNGERWGDSGVKIRNLLSTWSNRMHSAEFGGRPDRLTVGVDAWAKMEIDADIKDLMDTRYRGTSTELRRDMVGTPTDEAVFVGKIGTLDVYVYNDYYTVNGSVTPFMSSKDVVLSSPAVQGFRCFGAIQDVHAQFQPLPIFSRNYMPQGDVAVEQIVSQSAPLMVPVNPNATLRATVVA
jgi:hypothetical protein